MAINFFDKMNAITQRKGHAKGSYTDSSDGAVCSIQALHEAGGGSKEEALWLQAANELYPRGNGYRWEDIPAFNDTDDTTASMCYAVTQRARELRDAGLG